MQDQEIRAAFSSWSGGFPPSDTSEIQTYLDVASVFSEENDERVREALITWMKEDQQS